jgi:hypothetical protein
MAKRQTAVEWLEERYNDPLLKDNFISKAEFNQAKAMEKEQIIEAYEQGESEWTPFEFKTAQDYYTSSYGK